MSERRRIRQTYKFALDPTPAQEEVLLSYTAASRFFFNWGLRLVKTRIELRRAYGPSIALPWSFKELCSEFAKVKDDVAPWRREVVVGSQLAGLEALAQALRAFSARRDHHRTRFPGFRSKRRHAGSVIFQRGTPADSRHVQLDRRLGPIRSREKLSKLIRLLATDEYARILRATIRRHGRSWFVNFTVERSAKDRRPRRPNAAVGVDLGLRRLASLSTGEHVGNIRPLQTALAKLRRLERQLDRQRRAANPANYAADGTVKPGVRDWHRSRRMQRTERRIRRLHERVSNLRREQAHQLTTRLTREFGVVGAETLSVKGMLRDRHLSRHIADVAWAMILRQLEYKTSWAGSLFVAADRFYPSTKTCSRCGTVRAKLDRGARSFKCPNRQCGVELDRDVNAAINLAGAAVLEAQRMGIQSHVARTGRETENARRGPAEPLEFRRSGSSKREASPEAAQGREALALATRRRTEEEAGGGSDSLLCLAPEAPVAQHG
jgi:putative transposase